MKRVNPAMFGLWLVVSACAALDARADFVCVPQAKPGADPSGLRSIEVAVSTEFCGPRFAGREVKVTVRDDRSMPDHRGCMMAFARPGDDGNGSAPSRFIGEFGAGPSSLRWWLESRSGLPAWIGEYHADPTEPPVRLRCFEVTAGE